MGTTPNFGWFYGNEYDDDWWNTWTNLWTLVDAQVFKAVNLTSLATDLTFSTAGRGPVLTDFVTGHTYRLEVVNGIFGIQQLT